MGKIIDLTGQKFGKLSVLEITSERRNRQVVWKCQCDCGNITYVVSQSLRTGHTQSCGCSQKEKRAEDLSNQKFGKLLVLERNFEKKSNNRTAYWNCQCECGNIRIVDASSLRKGLITQCQTCALLNKKPRDPNSYIGPKKDHTNERFGKLVAIKNTNETKRGKCVWECKCDCGNIVYVDSNSLVSGNTQSCGCLKSKGEQAILSLLQQNNIKFYQQYSFSDCLSPKGYPLLFDFAIIDKNNQIKYLIEYDGIQHEKQIDFFGGEDEFNYLQECDTIKDNYAEFNKIKLIRINKKPQNILLQDILYDNL